MADPPPVAEEGRVGGERGQKDEQARGRKLGRLPETAVGGIESIHHGLDSPPHEVEAPDGFRGGLRARVHDLDEAQSLGLDLLATFPPEFLHIL